MSLFRFVVSSVPIDIDAPAATVWRILKDFDRYPEWNPFTISVEGKLESGEPVRLRVRWNDGSTTRTQTEFIEQAGDDGALSWGMRIGSPLILSALRKQSVTALSERQCRYENDDRISGLLAPLVKVLYRKKIERGFNGVARALKARAESANW